MKHLEQGSLLKRLIAVFVLVIATVLILALGVKEKRAMDLKNRREAFMELTQATAEKLGSLIEEVDSTNQGSDEAKLYEELPWLKSPGWNETSIDQLGLPDTARMIVLTTSHGVDYYKATGEQWKRGELTPIYSFYLKVEAIDPKNGSSRQIAQFTLDNDGRGRDEEYRDYSYSMPANRGIFSNHREWFSEDYQKMAINRIYEAEGEGDYDFGHFGWLNHEGEFFDLMRMLEFERANALTQLVGLGFCPVKFAYGKDQAFSEVKECYVVGAVYLEDDGSFTHQRYLLPLDLIESAAKKGQSINVDQIESGGVEALTLAVANSMGDSLVTPTSTYYYKTNFELTLFDYEDSVAFACSTGQEPVRAHKLQIPGYQDDKLWGGVLSEDGFMALMLKQVSEDSDTWTPESKSTEGEVTDSKNVETENSELNKSADEASEPDGSKLEGTEVGPPTQIIVANGRTMQYAVIDAPEELVSPEDNLNLGKDYSVLLGFE